MKIRAAFIGCGKRGQLHARGLSKNKQVEIAAFADPIVELAENLAREIGAGKAFADTQAMLAAVKPEFAVICTRPQARLAPIRQCVEAGVKAIQCEKPMAMSWNEALEIHALCEKAGVQLSFTHQRRFRGDFQKAKQLIDQGQLGAIERVEGFCQNMFDWGTHLFDLMFFLLDEPAAQWVLGAADFSVKNMVFDAPMDALGVSRFRFDNGVDGVLLTENIKGKQVFIRVLGSEAMMHVEPHGPNAGVYYLGGGTPGWDKLDLSDMEGPLEHPEAVRVSIDHSVQCMKTGAYPLHGSKMALKATELIFATYASAKLDRKIELPLAPNPDWHLERLFGE